MIEQFSESLKAITGLSLSVVRPKHVLKMAETRRWFCLTIKHILNLEVDGLRIFLEHKNV